MDRRRPSLRASLTRVANSASVRNSRASVPTGRPPSRRVAIRLGSVPPALLMTGVPAATARGRADRTSRVLRCLLDGTAGSWAGRAQTATSGP
ncbi:hypothetical protein [Lentzea albida]|uniref:hypothetical protein n=1 Tax=Lentzea albida TaxID=65499 RepID=UPI0015A6E27E|nr:hypothetical protein [Lentzea albida]